MIGKYWSTGITVRYSEGRWSAEAKFFDAGFCNDDPDTGSISTEGLLRTRYYVSSGAIVDGLTAAIDAVMADIERLGIDFDRGDLPGGTVYYQGDGEDPEFPPPAGWREMMNAQSERVGWRPCYGLEDGE